MLHAYIPSVSERGRGSEKCHVKRDGKQVSNQTSSHTKEETSTARCLNFWTSTSNESLFSATPYAYARRPAGPRLCSILMDSSGSTLSGNAPPTTVGRDSRPYSGEISVQTRTRLLGISQPKNGSDYEWVIVMGRLKSVFPPHSPEPSALLVNAKPVSMLRLQQVGNAVPCVARYHSTCDLVCCAKCCAIVDRTCLTRLERAPPTSLACQCQFRVRTSHKTKRKGLKQIIFSE